MKGIVDRIEEDRVVIESNNRMIIIKKSLFPEEIKEGDFIEFKEGKFNIDNKKTLEQKKEIDDLFNSLIDKE